MHNRLTRDQWRFGITHTHPSRNSVSSFREGDARQDPQHHQRYRAAPLAAPMQFTYPLPLCVMVRPVGGDHRAAGDGRLGDGPGHAGATARARGGRGLPEGVGGGATAVQAAAGDVHREDAGRADPPALRVRRDGEADARVQAPTAGCDVLRLSIRVDQESDARRAEAGGAARGNIWREGGAVVLPREERDQADPQREPCGEQRSRGGGVPEGGLSPRLFRQYRRAGDPSSRYNTAHQHRGNGSKWHEVCVHVVSDG